MEYEQLEYGQKVIEEAILQQDVGVYHDLLAHDVLLVSHFLYPTHATGPAAVAAAETAKLLRQQQNTARRKRQLLRQQEDVRAQQQARYDRQQLQQNSGSSQRRTGATTEGEETSSATGAAGDSATHAAAATGGSKTAPLKKSTGRATVAGSTRKADPAAGTQRSLSKSKKDKSVKGASSTGGVVSSTAGANREPLGVTLYFAQEHGTSASNKATGAGHAPSAATNTAVDGNAAAAIRGGGQHAPTSTLRGGDTTTAAHATVTGEAATAAAAAGTAAGAPGGGGDGDAVDYVERVDVVEGRTLVTERFCSLISWMAQRDYIAEVRVQLEPRKGILQESEVLPPPPAPRDDADRFAQLGRQYTERNQRLSRLIAYWGREHLQFCDVCYFEDGRIVTIHRRLLGLQEVLERAPAAAATAANATTTAQKIALVRHEVRDFYGVGLSRVAVLNPSWPLLDFSFVPLADPTQLVQSTPTAGHRHRCKGPRPAVDPRLAQGVFLNEGNDPTRLRDDSRVLIKAKNKQGEEGAYEFSKDKPFLSLFSPGATTMGPPVTGGMATGATGTVDAHGKNTAAQVDAVDLSKKPLVRYDASSVRVSGCGLGPRIDRLIPTLRVLVANAVLTIHSLDLSDNALTTLPDFTVLPLQKLQLHGNQIEDWAEVEAKVCPLPFLASLTLHGNPVSERNPQYWPMAVSRLLRHPNRLVKLRQLDFVTLTAQDYNTAGAFEMFSTGSTAVMTMAATMTCKS